MRCIEVDLSRFTTSGYGTVHGAAASGLIVGERFAVTDDEADTVEAEVLAVGPDYADVRLHWDRILHKTGGS